MAATAPGGAFLVVLSACVVASSGGILESLLGWELPEAEARAGGAGGAGGAGASPECWCQASGCLCCVDLNLTSTIDLGGPACVNVKQKEENVSLNLSYGDNPIHNATTRLADAADKPTCMNLLSDLAQICAKFVSVRRAEAGHDACLRIEPALLGAPQASYPVGCFNFHQGVRRIEGPPPAETADAPEDEDAAIGPEELIAAVSASAEQGIALFSRWLGLALSPEPSPPAARAARAMQDAANRDERFKQLLSAQDNIQKESARIGHADATRTTFVYAQPPKEAARRLPVIPRESRRGGRAYDIHRHVNEV
ncbi:uncharacterized protein LOC105699591 [Orussus abietinus]|uniref:uncharacterized protein LOC105699591 n=1 Tax=Orussus abietinus TaxID=222816 RepID=UPI000C716164|nr:uncharacterized protein LOC105699591 [Orussus abietinus]